MPRPRPTVTAIFPESGPKTGGTVVCVSGGRFTKRVSAVFFGPVKAPAFTFDSPIQLTVLTPDVTGKFPNGASLEIRVLLDKDARSAVNQAADGDDIEFSFED